MELTKIPGLRVDATDEVGNGDISQATTVHYLVSLATPFAERKGLVTLQPWSSNYATACLVDVSFLLSNSTVQ